MAGKACIARFLLSGGESRPRLWAMMIRLFLAAMAVSFAGFGLWSLLDPLGMTSSLGVHVSGPNAAYEMRGVYGGVSLGAAALMAAGALRQSMLRPALWFLITYLGGYVFARAAALLLGPAPTPDFYLFIAFESLGLILAAMSLRANAGR
ncbi:hypothetical protein HOC_17951 [Hyphomonas oceanitis SCH89]|uniref:DUF4345 domain-containing protein n=2 Tax=Hyphomonas oceanitis TaxID=81033 RepID=A0A059G295_9PROT|nr:hypothetical protein HOC_17951 [Hyphomonas oceanitis SCH89]